MARIAAIGFLLMTFFAGGGPARAQSQMVLEFLNGSDLINLSNEDQFAAQGYVTGVVDSELAAGTMGLGAHIGRTKICLPEHTTQAQLFAIVLQYVTNHNDAQAFPAAADVGIALGQAYPCG